MVDDVLLEALEISIRSIPLLIGGWAFLDAARRPRWVWAFAGRRQVIWLTLLFFAAGSGLFLTWTVVVGVAVAVLYLWRVRRILKSIEDGDVGRP